MAFIRHDIVLPTRCVVYYSFMYPTIFVIQRFLKIVEIVKTMIVQSTDDDSPRTPRLAAPLARSIKRVPRARDFEFLQIGMATSR
jgi:hypothetical protein